MNNNELKKLTRKELIDIIYQMKKNEEKQQAEIVELKEALQEKRLRISEAGSVSDAAMAISDVLNAAQTTADLYLSEIASRREEVESECTKMLEEANRKAKNILLDSEKRYSELRANYQEDYKKWKKLQVEILLMEDKKKRGQFEEVKNEKET